MSPALESGPVGQVRAAGTDHGVGSSPGPVVRVHGVTKDFGATRALGGVDLDVTPVAGLGTIYGIEQLSGWVRRLLL